MFKPIKRPDNMQRMNVYKAVSIVSCEDEVGEDEKTIYSRESDKAKEKPNYVERAPRVNFLPNDTIGAVGISDLNPADLTSYTFVEVENISITGILIGLGEEIPINAILEIYMITTKGVVKLFAQPVRWEKRESGYFYGCVFVDVPKESMVFEGDMLVEIALDKL